MACKDDSSKQLVKKIEAGKFTECEPAKLKLKSDVYSSFTLIFDKKKEVYQGYVRCKLPLCRKLVKHDLHKSGTSHLQKHIISAPTTHGKVKPAPAPQNQITGFISQKKVISERDKYEIHSAMSYYCSADLRPFSTIEGKGFEKIAQVFIQLGAKYGNIRAEQVIPSRTTVSEFCHAEATADREVFVRAYWLECLYRKLWDARIDYRYVAGQFQENELRCYYSLYDPVWETDFKIIAGQ